MKGYFATNAEFSSVQKQKASFNFQITRLFQALTSSTNKTDIFLAQFHYHVSSFCFFFITEATESNSFITFVISQIKDRNAGLSGHKYTANNTIRRERGTVSNKYGEAQVSLQFGSNECNYQTLLVQGVVARERGGEGLRDPGILLTHSSP